MYYEKIFVDNLYLLLRGSILYLIDSSLRLDSINEGFLTSLFALVVQFLVAPENIYNFNETVQSNIYFSD